MIFTDYLLRWKDNNSFPQCLIVKNIFCCDLLRLSRKYLKTLTCKHTIYCNECDICQRINKNAYIDFIFLENKDGEIKKEDILNIQKVFSNEATESSRVKLYVIKDIENINAQSINSLLKFIEEAPENTYALFFTKNPQKVLPTIRSRSQIISITDFEELLMDDVELKQLCHFIFNDINEYKTFVEQYNINEVYTFAKTLLNNKSGMQEAQMLNQMKEMDKDEFNVLLKFLIEMSPIKNKINLMEIYANNKLNLNRNLMLLKIFSEI